MHRSSFFVLLLLLLLLTLHSYISMCLLISVNFAIFHELLLSSQFVWTGKWIYWISSTFTLLFRVTEAASNTYTFNINAMPANDSSAVGTAAAQFQHSQPDTIYLNKMLIEFNLKFLWTSARLTEAAPIFVVDCCAHKLVFNCITPRAA